MIILLLRYLNNGAVPVFVTLASAIYHVTKKMILIFFSSLDIHWILQLFHHSFNDDLRANHILKFTYIIEHFLKNIFCCMFADLHECRFPHIRILDVSMHLRWWFSRVFVFFSVLVMILRFSISDLYVFRPGFSHVFNRYHYIIIHYWRWFSSLATLIFHSICIVATCISNSITF